MNADEALIRAFQLGIDENDWTDAVMDEAAKLLPTLIDAGFAAEDNDGARWWFTPEGVARYEALEDGPN